MVGAGNKPRGTSVRAAIGQKRPFQSVAQEALIGLWLAAEAARWPFQDLLAQREDLTLQQYNVLRILRGAGRAGLPTLEVAARMFERTPAITRMIDRLERKGLVERVRSASDRRQVLCHATRTGLGVLHRLDDAVDTLDATVMSGLTRGEQRQLLRLLNKLRNSLPRPD